MSEVRTAARLHLISGWTMVLLPLAVLASSIVLNVAVQAALTQQERSSTSSGGLLSVYVFVLVWAIQAMVQTFPLAVASGLTRRAFLLGTALVLVVQAVLWASAFTALARLEAGTAGFGWQLRFFRLFDGPDVGLAEQWGRFLAPYLLFAAVGLACGALHQRWRMAGIWTVVVGGTLLGAALVLLVTWRRGWSGVGRYVEQVSATQALVGLPLLATVALGLVAFVLARRSSV